jgi:hypothetical protein
MPMWMTACRIGWVSVAKFGHLPAGSHNLPFASSSFVFLLATT